jgi:hypothetical protein
MPWSAACAGCGESGRLGVKRRQGSAPAHQAGAGRGVRRLAVGGAQRAHAGQLEHTG